MQKFMNRLAHVMAMLGGTVLTGLILLVCLSIVGRTAASVLHLSAVQSVFGGAAAWLLDHGVGPVTGDFELVEAGMAFTVFAFLPICQISSSHATVDIVTNFFSPTLQRFLRAAAEVLFAVVICVIAWKLWDGLQDKIKRGDTSFLLQFPIWWAFAASFGAAVVAVLVSIYVSLVRVAELVSGRMILLDGPEAEH